MKNIVKSLTAFVLIASLAAIAGCSSDHPPVGSVSGTVTYDGEPLEKGAIVFEVSGQRTARGEIVNGQIQNVTTFEQGDGVPVGEAKVAISAVEEGSAPSEKTPAAEGGNGGGDAPGDVPGDVPGGEAGNMGIMSTPKFIIPPKYTNPETSGLTATIESGENVLDFSLEP